MRTFLYKVQHTEVRMQICDYAEHFEYRRSICLIGYLVV